MRTQGGFFYILIVLALAAIIATIFFLAPGAQPETPPVALAAPPEVESSDAPVPSTGTESRVLTVNPDTVQAVIATLNRVDSYSRTLTVRSFWNSGSAAYEISVWVRGESTRVAIRAEGSETLKNILIYDGEKSIWYSDAVGIYMGLAAPEDSDAWQTLLTYEDVLKLDKSDILDAGYTPYDGENCIYVRYRAGELQYENLCYVSVSTGLLMGVETYDGNMLVYAMSSSRPDISTPDEELFQTTGF